MNLNVLNLLIEENVSSKKQQFDHDLHELRAKHYSSKDICKRLAEKYSYTFEDARSIILRGTDLLALSNKSDVALSSLSRREVEDLIRRFKKYGVEYNKNHTECVKSLINAYIEGTRKYG